MKRIFQISALSLFALIASVSGGVQAGENAADAATARMAQARSNWLNRRIKFIEQLGYEGYDNLVTRVMEDTKAGIDSPDHKALSAAEQEVLKRATVLIKKQQVNRTASLKEKLTLAKDAITMMGSIVQAIPADSPMRLAAEDEQAGLYFGIAAIFADIYEKADKRGEDVERKDLQDQISNADKNASAVKTEYDAKVKEYDDLSKKAGAATGEEKTQFYADAKACKAALQELTKKKEEAEADLKGLRESLDGMVGAAVIRDAARDYYDQGLKVADPVRKKYEEDFFEKQGVYDEAQGKSAKDEAMRALQASFNRKSKLQHDMEDAWASRLTLYDFGSAVHQEFAKKADEFIDETRIDYDTYLPCDKVSYLNWIRVLSHIKEDVSQPATEEETGVEGKDLDDARNDAAHYLWPSVKLKFIWERHFLEKRGTLKDYEKCDPPSLKVKALFYYAEALLRKAREFSQRAAESGADKAKWAQLFTENQTDLKECIDLLSKASFSGQAIDSTVQNSAKLHITSDYYLFLAELAAKTNKDEAAKQVNKAVEEAVVVMSDPVWRLVAEKRLRIIIAAAETMGVKADFGPIMDIVSANHFWDQTYTEKSSSRKQELYGNALELYLNVIDKVKHVEGKDERERYLPLCLFRAGACAWSTGDDLTATLCYFNLIREFGGPKYPRNLYPNSARYIDLALNNLRGAAGKFLDADEHSKARMKLYADSLYLMLVRNPSPPKTLRFELTNMFYKLKLYPETLSFIDSAPASDPYYRMIILMGAMVHQDYIKGTRAAIDAVQKNMGKAERAEPTPEEQAILKEQADLAQEHGLESEKYAQKFIEAWKTRGYVTANTPKEVREIWEQEDKQVPAVTMIPLSTKYERGDYQTVIDGVENYVKDVGALKLNPDPAMDKEAKDGSFATVYQLKLLSTIKLVSLDKDPIDKCETKLDEAGAIVPTVEKYDEKEQRYSGDIPMMMGAYYDKLARRARDEAKDTAKFDALMLKAVKWYAKAERIAYEDFNTSIKITRTYFDQGLYQQAVDMGEKVIHYWGESIFSKYYLFREGKTLADLKAYAVQEDIKGKFAGILPLDEAKAATDEDKLVSILNQAITGFDYAKNKAAVDAILDSTGKRFAALPDNHLARQLLKSVDQAKALAARDDLAENAEARQKLGRYVVELAFPEVLALSAYVPMLPTPAEFDEQVKKFISYYPASADGKLKELVLKYMHDKSSERLESNKKRIDEYFAQVRQTLKTGKGEDKALAGKWLWLIDGDLKTYLYGVKDKRGRIMERSYYKARNQIYGIFDFNEKGISLGDSEPAAGMPTDLKENNYKNSFLRNADKALEFRALLLSIKRQYALSLVKLKRNADAERYLAELSEEYPADKELILDLADVYTKIGENLAETEFTLEAANKFMLAQVKAADVVRTQRQFTTLWWQAQVTGLAARYSEVTVRIKTGNKTCNYVTKVPEYYYKGKIYKDHPMNTPAKLDDEALNLLRELARMLNLNPPDDIAAQLQEMFDGLKAKGYQMPKVEVPESVAKDEAKEKAIEQKEAGKAEEQTTDKAAQKDDGAAESKADAKVEEKAGETKAEGDEKKAK